MARVADHLSVAELGERYRARADATEARHVQAIWLLAKGHAIADASATTAFGERWVERLLARHNERGPATLGDLRRANGSRASVPLPELLERLRGRLGDPPPDGGVWTSGKGLPSGSTRGSRAGRRRSWVRRRSLRSGAGRPWRRSAGRSRARARGTPPRRAPRGARRSRKARAGRRRGGRGAPGATGRGLRRGRAPHRPEADHAPRVGARRPAPRRRGASPLRMAVRE